MTVRSIAGVLLMLLVTWPVLGQSVGVRPASTSLPSVASPPDTYELLGIDVEGVEAASMQEFVRQQSGLSVGQRVQIPGDPAFADAIRALYRLGTFSDVEIAVDRRTASGVYLDIQVEEVPKLNDYTFSGIRKKHRDDLQEQVPLIKRAPVRPADVERGVQVIERFYKEKGYPLVEVESLVAFLEEGDVRRGGVPL